MKPVKSIHVGRKVGAKKYQKEILLKVIKTILPTSMVEWKDVADAYQTKSKEVELRDADDIKKHCQNGPKW
jgi:ribosomal protein L7/L12